MCENVLLGVVPYSQSAKVKRSITPRDKVAEDLVKMLQVKMNHEWSGVLCLVLWYPLALGSLCTYDSGLVSQLTSTAS